jgi:hypothetical protein
MNQIVNWVSQNRIVVLYAAAAIIVSLAALAAFISPAGAWPLSIIAVSLVFTANLDRFSEVSAGTSGFTAKMREAQGRINDLRKLIEVVAAAELHMLQSAGRWGGNRDDDLQVQHDRLVGLMIEVGVPVDRVKAIKAESWDRYVKFDYVLQILGGGMIPASHAPEIQAEWKKLRSFDDISSPAQLADFLARHGDGNVKRAELLRSYEHYWSTGEHLSQDLWRSRKEVPQLGGSLAV